MDSVAEKILNASEIRMLRFGYRKVSMDEIAQDLTMSKNTIYKYFQSKIELAESISQRLKEQINRELTIIEETNQDPLEIISKSVFYIQKQLGPWFEHFLSDIKNEAPSLYEDFISFRNEKINGIEALIQKGIKNGKFRKIHPGISVGVYLGAINHILTPEFLQQEKVSFPQALEAIMDIWSYGVLQKKG